MGPAVFPPPPWKIGVPELIRFARCRDVADAPGRAVCATMIMQHIAGPTHFSRVMAFLMTSDALGYIAISLFIASLVGCGGQVDYDKTFDRKLDSVKIENAAGGQGADSSGVRLVSDAGESSSVRRRIVYDAELTLVVSTYREFESKITQLVNTHDGFIAKSETSRRYEDRQSGTWIARIPVAHYSKFLSAVVELGFPESRLEEAHDITAEYVDVEARINNNQKLESRILELLEVREGKLSDVLEIERELARVRDEIERMQGRLRVLTDQSSLATITMKVREERQYVPPTAPTLSSRITSTWYDSLRALRNAGENLLIVAVAVVPWLFVLGIAALACYFIVPKVVRIARPKERGNDK